MSDGDGDSDCQSSDETPVYEGERNERGEPHGKGTLQWKERGERYDGEFVNGLQSGEGVMWYGDKCRMEGTWKEGEVSGRASYISEDGLRMESDHWVHGCIEGPGREVDEDGALLFEGSFTDMVRHGAGTVYLHPELTRIEASWHDGELVTQSLGSWREKEWNFGANVGMKRRKETESEDIANGKVEKNQESDTIASVRAENEKEAAMSLEGLVRYVYPDGSRLVGDWDSDTMEMREAVYIPPGMPMAEHFDSNATVYHYDESTEDVISSTPMLPDPYEARNVYVKESSLGAHAGDGLFAIRDLPEGTIVSFYSGLRLPHGIVDRRAWRDNANCLSIDEEVAVDVPQAWNCTKTQYCATLGHKANHSFDAVKRNAKYDLFFMHPRFGKIKCIRSTKFIKKNEEIFVDYDYSPNTGPQWYREGLKAVVNP